MVNSDRGSHFIARVMQEVWKLLGIQAKLHISITQFPRVKWNKPIEQWSACWRSTCPPIKRIGILNFLWYWRPLEPPLTSLPEYPRSHWWQGETRCYRYTCCTNLVTWISSPPLPLTSTWKSCISTWERLSPLRNSNSKEARKVVKPTTTKRPLTMSSMSEDKVWYYSFAQPRQNAPHRLSKKFLPHWTGPHEIVDKLAPVTYRITIRLGRSELVLRWVHRNQIKRHQGSSRQEKGEDQTHWHRPTMLWLWHWPSSYTSEWTPFKSILTNARPVSRAFSDMIKLTKNPNLRTQPTWLRSRLYRLFNPLIIKPIKMTQLQIILNKVPLSLLKFLTWPFPNYPSPTQRFSQCWRCCFVSCVCQFSLCLLF